MTRIRVVVTQADINLGKPNTTCYSPVGLAMERTLDLGGVAGGLRHIDVWRDGTANTLRRRWTLPRSAARAVRRFYRGRTIEPFAFYLEGPDR